jgi:hypothetical protein
VRRAFVIFIPALLLALMIVASRATANLHYVASGAPDDVLYAATFDSYLDDWQQYDDGSLAAKIDGSALHLTNNAPGSYGYSLATAYFGDFDLRVSARATGGPTDNGFGVIYRFQDQPRTTEATWRGLALRQFESVFLGPKPTAAYYKFLISSDGYYQVLRSVSGKAQTLSNWIPNDAVYQGFDQANELRVVAQGGSFQFSINGTPVSVCIPNDPNAESTYNEFTQECVEGKMLATLTDSTVGQGQIGVVAQSLTDPGVVVDFDNLVITSPQPVQATTGA